MAKVVLTPIWDWYGREYYELILDNGERLTVHENTEGKWYVSTKNETSTIYARGPYLAAKQYLETMGE